MDALKSKIIFSILLALFICQEVNAQYPKWDDPNSLPIWMTPEEETRRHEIGKNQLKSAAITGPVRGIAEFERMEGVLVRYPLGLPTSLIANFSKQTVVYTLVSTSTYESQAKSAYQSAGANMANCKFIRAATDSYWTRDYGPWYITTETDGVCILDFPYNRPRPNDNAVNGKLATYLGAPIYSMNVIHTGGNYMTDGWGISASTDLVLTENSNNEAWVRQQMHDFAGVDNYHIRPDPLGDYIKHIDCWGKFLDVDKVLITKVSPNDSRYAAFEAAASYFAGQTSAYGTPYQVFRVYASNGEPYTNSLILNKTVYVPTKNTSNDAAALNIYRQAMPGYTVTGIYYSSWQSTDALHCRAMGMADRKMLYIKHMPIAGTQEYQESFTVSADIKPYSGLSLKSDSLFVIYKTNLRPDWDTLQLVSFSGITYRAAIPVNPGETSVSYYLFAADNSGRRENHPFIGLPDPHTFNISAPAFDANFTASTTTTAVGQPVTFTDTSTGSPVTSWSWNFGQDAVPATASTQGPHTVYYNSAGSKTVSLTINGSNTETKTNYITVVVPVTGVTVTPETVSLVLDQSVQLNVAVTPANATNKAVTWSSSNYSVAQVNGMGLVTATGPGSATITVNTTDGGFTADCQVTVTVPVTGISLDLSSMFLPLGGTHQLNAAISPANASNQAVIWTTGNALVADVDQTGLVTAVGEGTTDITVTTVDGGYTAACQVTVGIPVTGISVDPSEATLILNESLQLTAIVEPVNATLKTVTWSSNNPAAVIVSADGLVTAVGNGTAVVTATTDQGGFSGSCVLTALVPVSGVFISPATATIVIGQTLQMAATVEPSNATNKSVNWTSSDPTLVNVSSTGLVTAVGTGVAEITVTTEDGGKTALAVITVSEGCTYQTINSEGFVNGWGIWIDGGTDCGRTTSYPNADAYSIYLRDNTSSSLMTTGNINFSAYNELTVTFSYYAVGFETGEDFWVQISKNGGSSYTTVLDLNRGTQFNNGVRMSGQVVIPGPFTSTTRLRFRADASADDDIVYIDNVVITGCKDPTKVATVRPEAIAVLDLNKEITVYPNPTNGQLNISSSKHLDEQVRISVISMTGQVIYQEKTILGPTHTLDLRNLVTGYCLLRIDTKESSVYKKILVIK